MLRILTVCTGNICRSPLAAALLGDRLAARGLPATVTSCGTHATGLPVPEYAHRVAAELGTSVTGHRARPVTANVLANDGADLVLCMDRGHLRHVVALDHSAWPRTFTLKELDRCATLRPPRPDEPLPSWLAALSRTRRPSDMMRDHPADDIADPYGAELAKYRRMASEVAAAVDSITRIAPWAT